MRVGAALRLELRSSDSSTGVYAGIGDRGSVNIGLQGEAVLYDDKNKMLSTS